MNDERKVRLGLLPLPQPTMAFHMPVGSEVSGVVATAQGPALIVLEPIGETEREQRVFVVMSLGGEIAAKRGMRFRALGQLVFQSEANTQPIPHVVFEAISDEPRILVPSHATVRRLGNGVLQ